MTNIQPLTSEEVLAKQVKENSKQAEERIVAPAAQVAPQPIPQQTITPKQSQKNDTHDLKRAGFTYRMPVGVHLLAFVYLEIFIALFLYATGLVALYAASGTLEMTEVGSIVSKEMGIAIVLSLALSVFIISGRDILRWCAIGIAGILAAIFSYQLYRAVSSLIGTDVSSIVGMAFFSVVMFAGIAALAAGLLLMLVTIIYLSRKKIASIYE